MPASRYRGVSERGRVVLKTCALAACEHARRLHKPSFHSVLKGGAARTEVGTPPAVGGVSGLAAMRAEVRTAALA